MADLFINSIIIIILLLIAAHIIEAEDAPDGKRRLKILIYNPDLGYSHMQFQGKLADVLVETGHEVHVLIFTLNPLRCDYNGTYKAKVIRVNRSPETRDDILKLGFAKSPFAGAAGNTLLDGTQDSYNNFFVGACEELLKQQQPLLQQLANENYDVGITESYDSCMFGIFHVIGVKTTISTCALSMTGWAGAPFGIPVISSYVTNYYAPSVNAPNMNFWDRISNFYTDAYEYFMFREKLHNLQQPLFKAIYGPGFPPLRILAKNVSLFFVNGNEFFELPKPTSHKVIYIGGIASGVFDKLPTKTSILAPEVQSIFDNAKDGVVLFSFGTVTDTKLMSQEMKSAFLKAFARFPTYDFIWKFERNESDSEMFSSAPNVHTFEWVNQKAMLAHPKLKAFITHCGLNGLNEAASEGVPMIGIPLFGDQLFNAATINHKKIGVYVDITDLHTENYGSNIMIDALSKVLQRTEYSQNAKTVQMKLRNMPFKPREKFVKWVEFAAEFPDLNELNLPTSDDMSLFVYYSLDVISFNIAVGITVILLLIVVICSLFRLFRKVKNFLVPDRHMQFNGKLADVLVEAGHEVHVLIFELSPFLPDYNGTFKAQKIIRIARSSETKYDILKLKLAKNPFSGFSNMLSDGAQDSFNDLFVGACEELLKQQQPLLQELARENYDVGISEAYDGCMFGIFHAIGVKTKFSTYAIQMTSWIGEPFGIPVIPSYVTNYFVPSVKGPNMNFWERISNFYAHVHEYFTLRGSIFRLQQPLFNSVYGPDFPSLRDIAGNISLSFVNGNEFFELPMPTSHKIVYVGGIASDVLKDLPEVPPEKPTLEPEVQSIFDNAKDGVVLFSFGTVIDTKLMSQEMKSAFLKAFARFPTYNFIWKFERNESDSEIFAPNVHTFGWVNQKAMLAHPKLKAFITHCGLNSMIEAASEGIPTIGIPLFGDQFFNAATINHKKAGVYIDILDLQNENRGSDAMIAALNKVLLQAEYSLNAKMVRKKIHNMPFKPREKFVKWVEFAAEFPDLNELNLPTSDNMSLFVYYSLDVISFSIAVGITVILLIYVHKLNFYNDKAVRNGRFCAEIRAGSKFLKDLIMLNGENNISMYS
ncbi:UDP-glucoronosyl and UDP-glucosyl transferase domain-containing protein [Ditylenchus destructor]|uniref:glucuronosyltransferase n=1 Tax=Ditylenchus destructor TaxID=166010 RepID=A0AAD4R5L2_9BILA|nr:UDP-glucoronosyl and UDP-glucosyl transferase domain-containing protein [Ditylenchus destructor]